VRSGEDWNLESRNEAGIGGRCETMEEGRLVGTLRLGGKWRTFGTRGENADAKASRAETNVGTRLMVSSG